MQALRDAELARAKAENREADGLVFRTTARRDDYLRRKANAERSGRYSKLED